MTVPGFGFSFTGFIPSIMNLFHPDGKRSVKQVASSKNERTSSRNTIAANTFNTSHVAVASKLPLAFRIKDTATKIFQFLDIYSLRYCKSVNKQWYKDVTSPVATMYACMTVQFVKYAILKQCNYMIQIPCGSNDCRLKSLQSKPKYWYMDCIHSLRLYDHHSIEIDNHLLSQSLLMPILCDNYTKGLQAPMMHNARININYNYNNDDTLNCNYKANQWFRYKSRVRNLRILAGVSYRVDDIMSQWIKVLNLIRFECLQSLEIYTIRGLCTDDIKINFNKPLNSDIKSNYKIIDMTSDSIITFKPISNLPIPIPNQKNPDDTEEKEREMNKIIKIKDAVTKASSDHQCYLYSIFDQKEKYYRYIDWRNYIHTATHLDELLAKITQWDEFFKTSLGIDTNGGIIFNDRYQHAQRRRRRRREMNINGIVFPLTIHLARRSYLWLNVDLNLNKSKTLVKCFEMLYKWYKLKSNYNITIGVVLVFCVTHYSHQFDATTVNSMIFNAKEANWIKLVTKAMTKIFKLDQNWDSYCDFQEWDTVCDDFLVSANDRKTYLVYDPISVNKRITIKLLQNYDTNVSGNNITNELKIMFQ